MSTSSSTSRHSNALNARNLAASPFAGDDDDVILSPSHGPSFLLEDRMTDQWRGISAGEGFNACLYAKYCLANLIPPQDSSQPSMSIKPDRLKLENQGKTST